jgi:hypothetical protein
MHGEKVKIMFLFIYLFMYFLCQKKLSENSGIPWRESLLWQYGIVTGFLRQFVMLKWNHCKVVLLIECGFNEMVVLKSNKL